MKGCGEDLDISVYYVGLVVYLKWVFNIIVIFNGIFVEIFNILLYKV